MADPSKFNGVLERNGIEVRIVETGEDTTRLVFGEGATTPRLRTLHAEGVLSKRFFRHFDRARVELVLAEQIAPSVAEELRGRGIMYMDLRGNCYLRGDGFHIDVRGRTGSTKPTKRRQTARSFNLFSPKRAQVGAIVLSYPMLLNAPLEQIAAASGVSIGTAAKTLQILNEAGYVRNLGGELSIASDRVESFIGAWADAFPSGLGLHLELFRGSGDITRLGEDPGGAWVSGEAAVPELVAGGSSLQLYTRGADPFRTVLRRGRLSSSDDGSIVLREAFWDPAAIPVHLRPEVVSSRNFEGWAQAPIALVYADLRSTGDPRLIEVSERLLATISSEVERGITA